MSGGYGPGPGMAHATGGGGGGFPTNAVLDNFNRANEGPPPSASWSGPVFTTDVQFQVSSNVAAITGGPAGSYWNTSFNADQEAYFTNATAFGGGSELWLRIQSPNSAGVDGIVINIYTPSGGVRVFEVVNGTYGSQIGATMTQTFTDGDSIGATVTGTTLEVWYKVGAGSWTSLGTRTVTLTNSGFIGMRSESGLAQDDFGGGNL